MAFPLRLEASTLRQLAVRHRLKAERKCLTTMTPRQTATTRCRNASRMDAMTPPK
jgi:hypothetical protein